MIRPIEEISSMHHQANLDQEELCVLRSRVRELEADAMVMALRLLGEDPETFGPECYVTMQIWGPKALKLVENP